MTWLQTEFLYNSIQNWLLALLTAAVTIIIFRLLERLLVQQAVKFARRTENYFDDFAVELAKRTQPWFLLIIAAYAGSLLLSFDPNTTRIIGHIVTIALFLQIAVWGNGAISFWVTRYKQERLDEDAGSVTVLSALGLVGKLVLWAVILLLILDNLGVEVTSLIAGLGISGIAVALAVQNILSDLFASLSIVLDKPFVIGDVIVVGDFTGTVERIGLKTTRLRSISGEQLVFSNTDLLTSRIRNYKSMQTRRVVFSLGVLYETPPQKLEQIPTIIQEAVESHEQARFDRAHFKSLDASALTFEVVYNILTPDYQLYMDTQQSINLALVRRFATEGIEFAYPTQTLFVKREA
ncbi:MAG: mechanosensitive ion channel family protein [Ardenticatenaceae bacterium]|nr:mechanosensitive ion channel family protein [Anaerolineales bacterium]MCB8923250.1 mechanosensitive ion channel family protein [Ardenticatenaceae bacterium]MCB9004805.1 mechanosensitive ion channel family protein [Ardenticatenaceae bacterium]